MLQVEKEVYGEGGQALSVNANKGKEGWGENRNAGKRNFGCQSQRQVNSGFQWMRVIPRASTAFRSFNVPPNKVPDSMKFGGMI